jgi:hypothetical protein
MLKKLFAIAIFLHFFGNFALANKPNFCQEREKYYQIILNEISKEDSNFIDKLPECFKQDRNLIIKALAIDPNQFQFTSEIIHNDKLFIKRAIKINADILKFVSPEVKSDENFMEDAIYINRDSLKYSSWSLLDNKLFMKKMIDLDSGNYQFASDRIKSMVDFAQPVLADNGSQLQFAPPNVKANREMVKLAIESDRSAIEFANPKIANEPEIIALAKNEKLFSNLDDFNQYIEKNYIIYHDKKNLGKIFANKALLFGENKLIDRNLITKWNKKTTIERNNDGQPNEIWNLINLENRNFQNRWKDDFTEFPDLVKKIEKFFAKRKIAPEIIEDLRTTYLWKIKNKPQTIAFNLYSLYSSTDDILTNNFVNVTSLTAIAQKHKDKWQISIIDVIFNREIKIDPVFSGGHKKYILWDLFKINENDKNPKIIFKIEGEVNDYMELYEEQINGKYRLILKSKPISKF